MTTPSANVAANIITWTPIVLAIVMFALGIYLMLSNQNPNNKASLPIFVGLVLVVFNIMQPSEFDFWKFKMVKTGVSEPSAIEASNAALVEPFIDKTNKALEIINKALSEQNQKINSLASVGKLPDAQLAKIEQIKTPLIPKIQISFGQSGKTVLVFYRSNQTIANEIVEALRKEGFKSAATNSSLTEVSKLVNNANSGSIAIAVNGSNDGLLNALKPIVANAISIPIEKIDAEDEWSFKASDAQIYVF